MKRVMVAAVLVLLMGSLAFAGSLKSYQVTGPVLEVKDDLVVVQKGKEKWGRLPATRQQR